MNANQMASPMLNLYPDSLGGTLKDVTRFLQSEAVRGAFGSLYILPSLYHTDLDRGFSVISYDLNRDLATPADMEALGALHIDLKLDFILNHASVLCDRFQDILAKGNESVYKDFFIDWNRFWEGYGKMTAEGYIQPDEKYLKDMFFRKPGLPILMVRFPDGHSTPYWNTFYQEVRYPRVDEQDLMRISAMQFGGAKRLAAHINDSLDHGMTPSHIDFGEFEDAKASVLAFLDSNRKYLGQMDLNIESPLVWEYYDQTLKQLSGYGARIVRLDAFAYAPKTPGKRNFLNEPDTWDLLGRVGALADQYDLTLQPEIHASYAEKTHEKLSQAGYMTYDFFLPGLLIDALECGNGQALSGWAREIQEKGMRTVNMLGCHDGIPLLDLKGLLPEPRIQQLIDTVVARGGMVKDLHGQKNVYYQVNATYFSALGENVDKMLLARAIQLFMPGKPQVWYLDLFAGKNDIAAATDGGAGGHKEINRTNLSNQAIAQGLEQNIVTEQLKMLRFRNTFGAFGFDSHLDIVSDGASLHFIWERDGCKAELIADLKTYAFTIRATAATGDAWVIHP
ncbi:MAG: glycosidase [Clostridiales bacterium]|nr:glycosidase [Clostridiales bacterium]